MPEVRGGVVPYLTVDGATKAAEFYVRAFGAVEVGRQPVDDQGRTMHVHLYVNGGSLMLCDAYPEHGHPLKMPQGFNLLLRVDDVDASWTARRAGGAEDRHAAPGHVLGRSLRPAPRSVRRHLGPRRAKPLNQSRDATMIFDGRRRWLALIVLCLGVLMIVLDTTIVNVALPSIRADLGFTETSLVWVVNAYMLTFGGFLLLGGRLGDLFGHRRLFLLGITLFTLRLAGVRPGDHAGAAGRGARRAGPRRRGGLRRVAVADHEPVHRAGRACQGDGRVRLRRAPAAAASACCSAAC